MVRRAFILSALVFTGLTAGCGSDEATAFPPGLQPFEAVTVPLPAATASDPHPEVFVTRFGEGADYEWAQGRGYIHAPLARVYEAMRDPEVTTDRRRVTEFSSTPNTEPEYPFSYRVHYIVRDLVTIEFDMSWRLGPIEGSEAAPTAVSGVYQKTFGSSFIDVLRGDVVARQVDANTTDIEMVRHIRSAGAGGPEAEQYLRDKYNSILARVRGQPLPRY
ncbi:MAG: hypothetical protein Q8S73_23255 [Deltaproteobacteria bacterium]|nr:hypothetical protein [Myxococcales bacterium]MDP3217048.1 hypothetical protein [Deltaproteobacteria bacterium]